MYLIDTNTWLEHLGNKTKPGKCSDFSRQSMV